MATYVIMPRQGQSVESCIITKLFIEEGGKVSKGDLLFAYETDKASFEEEADAEGIMLKWFYSEGDEVPVLENVCAIGKEGEKADYASGQEQSDREASSEDSQGAKTSMADPDKATIAAHRNVVTGDDKLKEDKTGPIASETNDPVKTKTENIVKISPRARRMAEDRGIDITQIGGSGPGGRIIVRDIEAFKGSVAGVPLQKEVGEAFTSDYKVEKLTNIRKLIASAMSASLRDSAQLTHHLGADARRILQLREEIKSKKGEKGYVNITINDMVCIAVVRALKKFPRVNSHLIGDEMRLFDRINLGIAVDTERGLMVPVIRGAERFSAEGISSETAKLAADCRSGSVDPDLISPKAASFTISNLGNYGVEMFTPVINLPQTAILGVNTIVPRPADLGGGVYGFVPYIGLSLTYDHRALDGAEASRFLKQIATETENLEI